MKRTWLNFILDAASALAILGLALTGLIMRYTLLPGTSGSFGGGGGMRLWGLTRHEWGTVHFWMAAGVGVVLVLHVALHWAWVSAMLSSLVTRKPATRPATRNTIGLTLLVVLAAGMTVFVLWTRSITEGLPGRHLGPDSRRGQAHGSPDEGRGTHGPIYGQHGEPASRGRQPTTQPNIGATKESRGQHSGDLPQLGQRSLAEIEHITGVRPEALLRALNLPTDLPASTRMREPANRTGLTMQQIRQSIDRLRPESSLSSRPCLAKAPPWARCWPSSAWWPSAY